MSAVVIAGLPQRRRAITAEKGLCGTKAKVLPITEAISRHAIALLETHFLSGGLRMADALIAATAIEHQLALATANIKHFTVVAVCRSRSSSHERVIEDAKWLPQPRIWSGSKQLKETVPVRAPSGLS